MNKITKQEMAAVREIVSKLLLTGYDKNACEKLAQEIAQDIHKHNEELRDQLAEAIKRNENLPEKEKREASDSELAELLSKIAEGKAVITKQNE